MATQNKPAANTHINDAYGAVNAPRELRITRLLPAAPQRVWAYLTEPDKSAQWLAAMQSDMKIGSPFVMTFNNGNLTDEATPAEYKDMDCSNAQGIIQIFDPPKIFSYIWNMGDAATEVIFDLTPQGTDTLLTLTHRKLPSRNAMLNVASGWHAHVGVLISKLQGEKPAPFWTRFTMLKRDYEDLIPAD